MLERTGVRGAYDGGRDASGMGFGGGHHCGSAIFSRVYDGGHPKVEPDSQCDEFVSPHLTVS